MNKWKKNDGFRVTLLTMDCNWNFSEGGKNTRESSSSDFQTLKIEFKKLGMAEFFN